jgi:hypothetical protein
MPTNRFFKYFKFDDKNKVVRYKGPEPQNIKEAFLISIAKWKLVCSLKTITGVDTGYSDTCGLCRLNDKEHPNDLSCTSCPVAEKTGKDDCLRTPHEDFINSHGDEEELRKYAKQELVFLKELYQSHQKRTKRKTTHK